MNFKKMIVGFVVVATSGFFIGISQPKETEARVHFIGDASATATNAQVTYPEIEELKNNFMSTSTQSEKRLFLEYDCPEDEPETNSSYNKVNNNLAQLSNTEYENND